MLPDEVPLLGVTSVPFEAAEFDAVELGDELDVPGLALVDVDADAPTLGFAVVLVGVGLALSLTQRVPVAPAVVLPALFAALLLAAAAADVLALLAELLVAGGVAVAVLVVLMLSLGLALLLLAAGLLLVLPLAGLLAAGGEGTLGVADSPVLAVLAERDGEGLGGHTVRFGLLGPMAVLAWLRPLAAAPAGLPGPAWLGVPPVLREVIPADWLSWTRAWRIGGTARATPMANKAQAIASVGRSSPSRQSRGWRRSCPAPVPRAPDDPPVPEP